MENLLVESYKEVDCKIKDIVYLESYSTRLKANLINDSQFIFQEDKDNILEKLPEDKFFKVNELYIINVDYIKKIKVSSTKNILLHGGVEIRILPHKYQELINFIKYEYQV